MSVLTTRPVLRWVIPAGVTLAVIGGGAAIGVITAAADPTLPARSAADLLVDLQTARLDGLSGTVVTRADLGLPALPSFGANGFGAGSSGGGPAAAGAGASGGLNLMSLAGGTHTVRVWYSGPDHARVALLGTLGETDLITNGTDVWTWDSRANQATHTTAPKSTHADGARPAPHPSTSLGALTPRQVADMALAAVDPSTEVTTQGTARIAGRDAYELVLAPKDAASTIGSVRLAIDAAAHVPLRAQVFARGAGTPAIEVAFTQISFARPDASQFTFNPPPGATVTEVDPAARPHPVTGAKPDATAKPRTAVIGQGWTSVLVARMPKSTGTATGRPDPAARADVAGLLGALPKVSGAWGSGHLFTTKLLTVLVTDDGRILVGAVSADRLYAAAADPAAQLTT